MVKNWLFEGQIYHERLKPFNHKFSYHLFFVKFPLSRIGELGNSVFSFNRFNLFSFYDKDYLDGSKRALSVKIKEVLHPQGIKAEGEIVLHTIPRLLGYGFNPVNFWYVYDLQGRLEAILSEVNNTFGDRHYYLLQNFDQYQKISSKKIFHVSPFFDIKGDYQFSFNPKSVVINYFDNLEQDYFFKSSIAETSNLDYSTKNLLKMFFKYPLMSFMVMFRIHWQALILFLKKAQFYRRPEPPKDILTKEVYR
jgi:DUF1365 family protein